MSRLFQRLRFAARRRAAVSAAIAGAVELEEDENEAAGNPAEHCESPFNTRAWCAVGTSGIERDRYHPEILAVTCSSVKCLVSSVM